MQPQVLHCFIFRQQQARTAGNECFIVRPAKSHVCVGTYGMCFFLLYMRCADVADVRRLTAAAALSYLPAG